MSRHVLTLAAAGLLCLQACASEVSEPVDERSLSVLEETFGQLPISVEPRIVTSEDSPPRLVVSTGVAFQTMDFINDELSEAFAVMGFVRSSQDETVWDNDAGVRIDVGARPTLLEIEFSG